MEVVSDKKWKADNENDVLEDTEVEFEDCCDAVLMCLCITNDGKYLSTSGHGMFVIPLLLLLLLLLFNFVSPASFS